MEENEERIKELIKSFCQQTEEKEFDEISVITELGELILRLIEYFDVDINNNMQK